MRRLWLRWAGLAVFVIVLALVFIRLGEWQIHRLDARRASNELIRTHQGKPPVDWRTVFKGEPITDQDAWQRVTVTGTYSPDQLRARYRSVNDQSGSEVLTVLTTKDGRQVLIDRGFLPTPKNTPEATMPAPPTGEVTVTGWVRRSENGKPTATKPVEGNVRLINVPMINSTLGLKLADGYIQLISSTSPQPPGLTPVPPPELDEGPHQSYAIQWFIFTVIAVGGGVILVRGDLKDRRRREQRAAQLAARAAAQEQAGDTAENDDAAPADTPAADTPAADTPAADTPAADIPAADTPAADEREVSDHHPHDRSGERVRPGGTPTD